MGHITLEQKLARHAFAKGLTESQIATLAALAQEVTFADDELILVDGQRSKAFYLLTSGSVAVELRTPRFVGERSGSGTGAGIRLVGTAGESGHAVSGAGARADVGIANRQCGAAGGM